MFTDKDGDFVRTRLSTTRYLGRESTARQFFGGSSRLGGVYVPEKWGTDETTPNAFDPKRVGDVVEKWTMPTKAKRLFFHRKQPVEIQMSFSIDRFPRAKFNTFSACVRDKYFESPGKMHEYLDFVIELSSIFAIDYGVIAQITQKRRQSAIFTPAERLEGIYWANFFGRPYIEFFGRDKLLATPCHEVRVINDDLILLQAAESPYKSEMLETDDVVNSIKAYLNQNSFAGPNFPNQPCAVPEFDFSDVRSGTHPPVGQSPRERVTLMRSELESKGYKLVSESPKGLILRGKDGLAVLLNPETGELSVDTTGTLFLPSEP